MRMHDDVVGAKKRYAFSRFVISYKPSIMG